MADHNRTSKELPEWLVDLILQRSTTGIEAHQEQELESFLAKLPDREQVEDEILRFELTAAAIDLSFNGHDHTLPPSLHETILKDAKAAFEKQHPLAVPAAPQFANSADSTDSADEPPPMAEPVVPAPKNILTRREAFGWLVAAASVMLLLTGWNPFAKTPDPIVTEVIVEIPAAVVAEVPPKEQLNLFVGDAAPKDLLEISFTPLPPAAGKPPVEATGRVVWSDLAQQGFLILQGLQPNDPAISQYQLWIFDTDKDQKYPIDGGVFDIAELEEIIAIDAKIKVDRAVRFAVTEEKSGGVVVSTRERLPLLADVSTE